MDPGLPGALWAPDTKPPKHVARRDMLAATQHLPSTSTIKAPCSKCHQHHGSCRWQDGGKTHQGTPLNDEPCDPDPKSGPSHLGTVVVWLSRTHPAKNSASQTVQAAVLALSLPSH